MSTMISAQPKHRCAASEASMNQLTISAQANFGVAEVKARSAGRSQNRQLMRGSRA
ncbi:MAG: hypothetical protein K2Q19_04605 [Rhodocyclaceae bacterium]|nr:hypothetical protein [Rhodocyclaceae bacterium]